MKIKLENTEFLTKTQFADIFLDSSKQYASYALNIINNTQEEEESFLQLLYKKLATANEIQQARIYYLLGSFYLTTGYLYKDQNRGLGYFELAIALDDDKVMINLGYKYMNGQVNGQPNYPKAKALFEKTSALGNPKSMNNLAHLYLEGKVDGQPDYLKAKELFENAMDLNEPSATYNLGLMYYKGQINGQADYPKAKELFEKAAALNDSGAMLMLGSMYEKGHIDGQPNYPKAKDWYEKSAALNHPVAMLHLGCMYFYGQIDGQPNYPKAKEWFEKSAAFNHPRAMFNLGFMYENGQIDGQPNYPKAKEWFEKSAALNNLDGLFKLGAFYKLGTGVIPDKLKAAKLYRQGWALDTKKIYKNEMENLLKESIEIPVKYHCTMALCPESIIGLLKASPEIVGECILNDDLLTPQIKMKLFFNQSILSILEEHSIYGLIIDYYLYFAEFDNEKRETHYMDAFQYHVKAKSEKCEIRRELTQRIYYFMARMYDESGDNYQEAIMLCYDIQDYIPAQHLLAQLLFTHPCNLPPLHRHFLCFEALKHETDLPSIPIEGFINMLQRQYQTELLPVKNKNTQEQITWFLEKNQSRLTQARLMLTGWVLVWRLVELNDFYDGDLVDIQLKELLPHLSTMPVKSLYLWEKAIQDKITSQDGQILETDQNVTGRDLCSNLSRHFEKAMSTYAHKWMFFSHSVPHPQIMGLVNKTICDM